MRKRVFFLIILLVINAAMLTGCWNYSEVDKFSIVAGVAVDKSEEGKYMLTIEIVDLHEGGRDAKIKSKLLETYGDTVFDAVRNAIKITAQKLYWGHAEIVILSREAAREGIVEIIDWLDRDAEPRLTIDILVSKEKTAKEILDSQSITTEIRSFEINKMLDTQRSLSKTFKVEVYEFIKALSDEGVSAVLPCVHLTENVGKKTSELSGTAVFKEDKLVGFLDDDETKYLRFITDKIKGGLLVLKEKPESGHANMTLEIFENKTKVKPAYANGKVSINIEIKTETALDEHGAKENFIDENRSLVLERDAEELLRVNIKNLIRKVQKDFNADIFGFGSTVRADMPPLWKEIGPDWDKIYKDLDVYVNATVEVQNSGLLSKPVKVGD